MLDAIEYMVDEQQQGRLKCWTYIQLGEAGDPDYVCISRAEPEKMLSSGGTEGRFGFKEYRAGKWSMRRLERLMRCIDWRDDNQFGDVREFYYGAN